MGLATMIITPTEAIRREAIERFRLTPARVIAVPHAAPANFRPTETVDSNGAYFLCVGTLEPRKNIETLIEAWRQVRATHPFVELVLAGRRRADFGELPCEPGLRVLGEVTEEELPRLYSGARACIYPSWYEGFGLPVLEAMQCGTPVIASNGAAIAEVAGDAAWLIDPRDPKAWADALEIAIDQPGWREEWQARCLLRAAEFSWERTASETHEVYVEAIRRFRRKR
jgi:alpha-1,3-rhamnosyl/mannosyltransferase